MPSHPVAAANQANPSQRGITPQAWMSGHGWRGAIHDPAPWLGLDRLGVLQVLEGIAHSLIARFSSFDHIRQVRSDA